MSFTWEIGDWVRVRGTDMVGTIVAADKSRFCLDIDGEALHPWYKPESLEIIKIERERE